MNIFIHAEGLGGIEKAKRRSLNLWKEYVSKHRYGHSAQIEPEPTSCSMESQAIRESLFGRAVRSDLDCRPFDQAIISGFELFVTAGPLCHEIMRGVAVIVEEWTVDEDDAAVAGQLMTAMRATCKAGAEKLALRLVAAMYRCVALKTFKNILAKMASQKFCTNFGSSSRAKFRCTVTTASQALGKVHAVLAQRKAKVIFLNPPYLFPFLLS
ncbi:unnamed protein product [Strongylus vulgaris]|uniref:Uncharacterized protein n=1 Tax=Strongylus vulgaris TaxID=40348 RepID=A0A3P7J5D1_STRVU|nr:unnamed protein product [Strongylus vulgaris]